MFRSKTVPVVVDDPDISVFVSDVLRDNGSRAVTAADGTEGPAKAREERPEPVFPDLLMPNKCGLRFLNEAGRDTCLSKIPLAVPSGATRKAGVDMEHNHGEQPSGRERNRGREARRKSPPTPPWGNPRIPKQ